MVHHHDIPDTIHIDAFEVAETISAASISGISIDNDLLDEDQLLEIKLIVARASERENMIITASDTHCISCHVEDSFEHLRMYFDNISITVFEKLFFFARNFSLY